MWGLPLGIRTGVLMRTPFGRVVLLATNNYRAAAV